MRWECALARYHVRWECALASRAPGERHARANCPGRRSDTTHVTGLCARHGAVGQNMHCARTQGEGYGECFRLTIMSDDVDAEPPTELRRKPPLDGARPARSGVKATSSAAMVTPAMAMGRKAWPKGCPLCQGRQLPTWPTSEFLKGAHQAGRPAMYF